MENLNPQPVLPQDCLDKLNHVLDLVLKTAEAASAENKHKLVIQSAREATRIVALMHKMTTPAKPGRSPRAGQAEAQTGEPCAPAKKPSARPEPTGKSKPVAGQKGQTGVDSDNLTLSDLETYLALRDPAYWDAEPGTFFQKFSNNRELQVLEKEVNAFLRDTNKKSGAAG